MILWSSPVWLVKDDRVTTPAEQLAHFMYVPQVDPGPGAVTTPSSFFLAAGDARVASGRDPKTGAVVNPDPPTKWLGAIGYMAMFDLLGTAVTRPSVPSTEGNAFRRTLEVFSAVPAQERATLYALRNAFAHDYSLINQGPAGMHLFRLEWDGGGSLVQLPNTPWDGTFPVDPAADDTICDLFLLTELGEEIIAEVFTAFWAGDLELLVHPDEAEHRYFVTIS